MAPSPGQPNPLHTLAPAAAVFALWLLVCAGILALGAAPLDLSALQHALVPLFSLFFIVLLAALCAFFTLFQEPRFARFPALRRAMLLGSLALALALAAGVRGGVIAEGPAALVISANLIVFALLLGNALVSALRRPSELIPVCAVMSAADLFSVFAGPSKTMAASIETYYREGQVGAAPWSDFLLIKIAVPGAEHLVPVFGVADVIILAFLTAAARKFGIDDNVAGRAIEPKRFFPYFSAAACGLAAALLAAQALGVFLPALPAMALFFFGYTLPRHRAMRNMHRTEAIATVIGCALVAGLTASALVLF